MSRNVLAENKLDRLYLPTFFQSSLVFEDKDRRVIIR